jgi:hypothetical protein
MRTIEAGFALMLVAVAACLTGCAGNRVPREWRLPASAAQRSSHGGWIRIETVDAPGTKSRRGPLVEGELIAIDQTAFHVLTTAGLRSVPRASARRFTVVGFGNEGGALTGWSVAGGISTLSHGWFLVFTAPMWAVVGVIATRSEKHAGVWHDEAFARRFARFPQGLPPNLDPKALGALPGGAR